MNQPKFKHGDIVVDRNTMAKFEVFAIAYSKDVGHSYRDEYYKSLFIQESELISYQEPKAKKLYAYREDGKNCQIFFFSTEDANRDRYCARAPEFDIIYPEAK